MSQQQQQQHILVLLLIALAINVTYGCVCVGTLERQVRDAHFAALAKVTSDVISSPKGLYYEIDKKCLLRTPFGTDIERAYATSRPRPDGIRTSCDGTDLDKDKVYLIIGNLYNRDDADAESVSYYGCTGLAFEWDNMNSDLKDELKNLLPFDIC